MIRTPILWKPVFSSNLTQIKESFVCNESGLCWVQWPVNPGWIPENLSDEWTLEASWESDQNPTLRFENTAWNVSSDSVTPKKIHNVLLDISTPGQYKLPPGDYTYCVLSTHLNIDEQIHQIQITMNKTDAPQHKFSTRVKSYPENECLYSRCEREQLNDPDLDSGNILFKFKAECCSESNVLSAINESNRLESLGAKIVNHPKYFENHNCKDATFKLWEAVGLPIPYWEYYESIEQSLNIAKRTGYALVRCNDMACGQGTIVIKDTMTTAEAKTLIDTVISTCDKRRNEDKPWCKIIVVEKILPDSAEKLLHLRTFVSNGTPFCTCVMLTKSTNNMCLAFPMEIDDAIKGQVIAEARHIELKEQMRLATTSLGIECCAVDWFSMPDGRFILLEANAFWGMGASLLWPYNSSTRTALEDVYMNNIDKFPCLGLRLDEWKFWSKFHELIS